MAEPSVWGFVKESANNFGDWIMSPINNTPLRGMRTLPGVSGGEYPYTGVQTQGAYRNALENAKVDASRYVAPTGTSNPMVTLPNGSVVAGGYSEAPKFNLSTGQYEQVNQSLVKPNVPLESPYFGSQGKLSTVGKPQPNNVGLTKTGFTEAENINDLLGNSSSGTTSDLSNIQDNTKMPLVDMNNLADTGQSAIASSANALDYNMSGSRIAGEIPAAKTSELTVDQQQTADKLAFDKEMAPWTKASQGMEIASSGLNALSGLYNAYMAHKTYELSKDSFEYNRSLSNVNLENQAKLVNQDLADRQAIRASRGGQSVDDFMATNSVRGRV